MNRLRITVVAALAMAFAASPALAQGKGGKERVERPRQEVRRDDDRRQDRREGPVFGRRSEQRVPPGWCRGRGNPHNTTANCGYQTDRVYRDRDGVWRDRNGEPLEREGIYRDIEGILRDRAGRRLN